MNVVGFIVNKMPRKIVDEQADVPMLLTHPDVKRLEPPVG